MSKTDTLTVGKVMMPLGRFPVVSPSTFLKSALEEMGKMGLGIVCVVDGDGRLAGILTDGDVRRQLLRIQKPFSSFFSDDIIDHAIKAPTTVAVDSPLPDAVGLMEAKQVWDLPVIGNDGQLAGLLHLHPVVQVLLKAG